MKIALLSDIHGNYVALEECLKYIESNNFDGVAFLGDYITDCPYPQRTLKLVRETINKYKTWCIRGNREDYILNHRINNAIWTYNSKTGNFLYTYNELTEDDFGFFENMPINSVIDISGCKPIMICHGSPGRTNELLTENGSNSREWLEKIETDYLFVGHNHNPCIYKHKNKTMIVCGSVGMPVNNQTDAQFTQIENTNGEWKISLVSLPYNISALLHDFEESGIYDKYHWWALLISKCIQTGINYSLLALTRAKQLADNQYELIDEIHWEQAINELGIG